MAKHRCSFCGYTGNNRVYFGVGIDKHPKDEMCELCVLEGHVKSEQQSEVAEDCGDVEGD
jgi:hypothetical protein